MQRHKYQLQVHNSIKETYKHSQVINTQTQNTRKTEGQQVPRRTMHSVQADKLPMQIHAPSNDIGGAFSDGPIVLLISFRWFTLPKNGWEKNCQLT